MFYSQIVAIGLIVFVCASSVSCNSPPPAPQVIVVEPGKSGGPSYGHGDHGYEHGGGGGGIILIQQPPPMKQSILSRKRNPGQSILIVMPPKVSRVQTQITN